MGTTNGLKLYQLVITSYKDYTPDAEHYYARVKWRGEGQDAFDSYKLEEQDISYRISFQESCKLNRKDGGMLAVKYRPGDTCLRFFSAQHAIQNSCKWVIAQQDGGILTEGDFINPGKVWYLNQSRMSSDVGKRLLRIANQVEHWYTQTQDPLRAFGKMAQQLWDEWEALCKENFV